MVIPNTVLHLSKKKKYSFADSPNIYLGMADTPNRTKNAFDILVFILSAI